MRLLLSSFFIFYFFLSGLNAQITTTLYYNDQGELTIPALSSHFRVTEFDSLTKEFNGVSKEYNADSLLTGVFDYSQGQLTKLKLFDAKRDTLMINVDELSDSLNTILQSKNSFSQAKYIRKNDYELILNKLSPIPMDVPDDSTMWEGKMIPVSEIFTIVEDPAAFPGGMNTMIKFLSFYLVYPKEAQEAGITGKVYVEFVINKNGTISDARATKGIGYGCDEAAVYAVSKLPDWKPGYQRGKPVRVKMTLPITFQ